jgi:hypothetical protein
MADITVTAAQVRRVASHNDEVHDFTAASTITAGQPVYFVTASGKVAAADGSAADTAQVRGVALNAAAAGETVAVLKRGKLAGFTLTSQNFDDRIYLSNTNTGVLADSAGTVSVVVGRVIRANDSSATKLLYVDTNWLTQYS